MDHQAEEATVRRQIGERIAARRKELRLSMRDLAARTDLSPTVISSIERGMGNPTLESVRKLANALRLPIYRLLEAAPPNSQIVRAGQRTHMSFPGNVVYEILTPHLTKRMVLFQVRATQEVGNMVRQPLAEPGEECILVLSGQLEICIAGVCHELKAGDSIYFENHELESVRALGEGETIYVSAISRPNQ